MIIRKANIRRGGGSLREWLHYSDDGGLTVVENEGESMFHTGDAACWPAGVPNAHHAVNRSAAPCTYLIVGTLVTHDVCRYPDSREVLHTEGEQWRLEKLDGTVLKSGRCKSPPGRD